MKEKSDCACAGLHTTKLVVLTGGPGAGKTAVLEIVRRAFCRHIAVLPEAATIVFGGGFPRPQTEVAIRATQHIIFDIQRELERASCEDGSTAIALCDRGTLDGLAYWPDGAAAACRELGIDRGREMSRYATVIHLRTPTVLRGYNHANPARIETADEAHEADARTAAAWDGHPRRFFVESEDDFVSKITRAVALIRDEVPACCRRHRIAEMGEVATS